MEVIFYKLITYTKIKEDTEWLSQKRDKEYHLHNYMLSEEYNPFELLHDLEADINSQLLTGEVYEYYQNNYPLRENDYIEYLTEFDKVIKRQFKHLGKALLHQITMYLMRLK